MPDTFDAVNVTSSATLIVPSNPGRVGLVVRNNGSETVYLGKDSTVTIGNGMPLATGERFTDSGPHDLWRGALYGIAATGPVDVRFWFWNK